MKTVFRLLVVIVLLGAVVAYFRWRGSGHAAGDLGALRERVGDAKVAALVRAALAVHRDLARCDVAVSAEDGVVTLRGEVPDTALRARAEALAAAVPGVRQVVNHVRVAAGASSTPGHARTLGESLDDRTVEMRVRLALSLDRSVASAPITVAVFRKQVTLAGEVADSQQAETALRLAGETVGVDKVIDRLRVRGETASRVARVRRALAGNAELAPRALIVSEKGGRIVLRGRVRSAAERDLAGLLAEGAAEGPIDNGVQVVP